MNLIFHLLKFDAFVTINWEKFIAQKNVFH